MVHKPWILRQIPKHPKDVPTALLTLQKDGDGAARDRSA